MVFTSESGQTLYKHRHYHPELGRWLSRDPIGEIGGFNLYSHLNNLPLRFFDVLGAAPAESQDFTKRSSETITPHNQSYSEGADGEGKFHPEGWGSPFGRGNNCVSYACNTFNEDPIRDQLRKASVRSSDIDCDAIRKAIKAIATIIEPDGDCCPEGFHRIHLRTGRVKDGTQNRDYHAYRQNSDGTWTHFAPEGVFPGGRDPMPIHDDAGNQIAFDVLGDVRFNDAKNNPIGKSPYNNSHDYRHANYDEDCGIFCAKTGD